MADHTRVLLAVCLAVCLATTVEGYPMVTSMDDSLIQLESSGSPVALEPSKGAQIIHAAKAQAKVIEAKALSIKEAAEATKARIQTASVEVAKQLSSAKAQNAAAHEALSQANNAMNKAEDQSASAERASQGALIARTAAVAGKKAESKQLKLLDAKKVLAGAAATEEVSALQAKERQVAQTETKAKTDLEDAAATKEALRGEITATDAARAKNAQLEQNLKAEKEQVKEEKSNAKDAMSRVQKAKKNLGTAAKVAIKTAIKHAAAVANAEQTRLGEQMANELNQKGAASAKNLAQEAKIAAKQQIAEDMMSKAQKMMKQVKHSMTEMGEAAKPDKPDQHETAKKIAAGEPARDNTNAAKAAVESVDSLSANKMKENTASAHAAAKDTQEKSLKVRQEIAALGPDGAMPNATSNKPTWPKHIKASADEAKIAKEEEAAAKIEDEKELLDLQKKSQNSTDPSLAMEAEEKEEAKDLAKAEKGEAQAEADVKNMTAQVSSEKSKEDLEQEKEEKLQAHLVKMEKEKEAEKLMVFAATARAHKFHKSSMSIAKGALNCDEVVKTLREKLQQAKKVVKQDGKNAQTGANAEISKSQMMQNAIAQIKSEKLKTAEALKRGRKAFEKNQRQASFITVLEERIASLKSDGGTLAKGLKLKDDNVIDQQETIAKMEKTIQSNKGKVEALQKKADMLVTCQQEKSTTVQKAAKDLKNLQIKLAGEVTKAVTKAAISKRGYELCHGELENANAASNAVKATAMQTESQLADTMANLAKKAKTMRTRITASVSGTIHDEEKAIYENKLDKAVNNLAKKKPMTPKCKVCAKLSGQEKIDLKADCGTCSIQQA